jgi:ribose/xylose/arabinose/galactoside ABC-type transport system permease subunit
MKWKRVLIDQSILIVFLLLILILSLSLDKFFTFSNLINIMRQVSIMGIMACGATVVIIGGHIDLSIGSILSLVMIVMIKTQPYGYFVSVISGIATGVICGLINGVIIGKYRANFFMTTLSTLLLYQGFALLISGGYNLKGSIGKIFIFIGRKTFLNIPIMVFAWLAVAIVIGFILRETIFGRRVYAMGSNISVTSIAGINVPKMIIGIYTISGLTSGIAGVILISRLTMAQPAAGAHYLFDVITAVLIGGISLSGGQGNIFKTILGVVLIGTVINGMALIGMPFEYQHFAKGVIFIFAILYDEFMKRKRAF